MVDLSLRRFTTDRCPRDYARKASLGVARPHDTGRPGSAVVADPTGQEKRLYSCLRSGNNERVFVYTQYMFMRPANYIHISSTVENTTTTTTHYFDLFRYQLLERRFRDRGGHGILAAMASELWSTSGDLALVLVRYSPCFNLSCVG
jgi:hypothetical protein